MTPTLKSGQPFILDRKAYQKHPISRNDIIVFKRNGATYVKRVAAVEGDSFYVLRYLDTYWDALILPGQYPLVKRMMQRATAFQARLVRRHVPVGFCYVVGDATHCSEDSRAFGPIPLEAVQGKLLMAPTVPPDSAQLAAVGGPARL